MSKTYNIPAGATIVVMPADKTYEESEFIISKTTRSFTLTDEDHTNTGSLTVYDFCKNNCPSIVEPGASWWFFTKDGWCLAISGNDLTES